MVPKDVQVLILRTCEYIRLHNEEKSNTDEIEKEGDYPRLSGYSSVVTGCCKVEEGNRKEKQKKM